MYLWIESIKYSNHIKIWHAISCSSFSSLFKPIQVFSWYLKNSDSKNYFLISTNLTITAWNKQRNKEMFVTLTAYICGHAMYDAPIIFMACF